MNLTQDHVQENESLFYLHRGLNGRMDFSDFVPLFMPFSLAGVVTNNSMALYFVGEKHQRRRSFCLHHGLIGWRDFADFWVCVPSANVGANCNSPLHL
jgi:hypothetical protein